MVQLAHMINRLEIYLPKNGPGFLRDSKVWHMDDLFGMFYMKGSFVDVFTHLNRDKITK